MALVIRLSRAGANKKPLFHIVLTDKPNPRDGKFLKSFGLYNPKAKDPKDKLSNLDREAIAEWVKKGAIVSETVGHLLKATAQ